MTANCIYCGRFYNPLRGEGDHILSGQLFGIFCGDKRFRGCCGRCNNDFGRFEQMAAQSSHLGHCRLLARPKLGRSKRGTSLRQRGYKGGKAPKTTIEIHGRRQLVEWSDKSSDMLPVDQLIILDNKGQYHHVRLFPGMSHDKLRADVRRLGVDKPIEYGIACDEKNANEFAALAKEVLSLSRIEELPTTEPGNYRVRGRSEFYFTTDYYRLLAKIAFHYYLTHNTRGFVGNESYFAAIRRFIKRGQGNVDDFFRLSGPQFVTPYAETRLGPTTRPMYWFHLLAASEFNNAISVCLQLYNGPERIPVPDYVTLANINTRVILPDSRWAHVYQMEPHRRDKYAGRVIVPTISKLKRHG